MILKGRTALRRRKQVNLVLRCWYSRKADGPDCVTRGSPLDVSAIQTQRKPHGTWLSLISILESNDFTYFYRLLILASAKWSSCCCAADRIGTLASCTSQFSLASAFKAPVSTSLSFQY